MRIIAGSFRGRPIKAPKGTTTRPTTDRVRESLFSAISSALDSGFGGISVLDAFAGSGALGLEALSRGASRAVFAEQDRFALSALEDNVRALGVEGSARIQRGDAFSLARRGVLRGPFSLILLDPPYTLDPTDVRALLSDLTAHGEVEEGALVTWEHATGTQAPWPQGYRVTQCKRYGSTEVEFATFERESGES